MFDPLLNTHVETKSLLRVDVMVGILGRLIDIDLDPINLSGEAVVFWPIIVTDGRTGLEPDVTGFSAWRVGEHRAVV